MLSHLVLRAINAQQQSVLNVHQFLAPKKCLQVMGLRVLTDMGSLKYAVSYRDMYPLNMRIMTMSLVQNVVQC
jgi:hypothetical protein